MKFQKILQNPNLAVRMCETKGKRKRAVEKWKLPTLFGDELQSAVFFQLAFSQARTHNLTQTSKFEISQILFNLLSLKYTEQNRYRAM